MRYEWILFDLDDTLLDFKSSARLAFSTLMQEVKVVETPGLFDVYQTANHQAWSDFEKGKISALELRSQRFRDFVQAAGLQGLPAPMDLNARFLKHVTQHTFLLEGALQLLESLQGKVKLGIVTNGLKEVQRPRIRASGIDAFFQTVLVSDELGVAKPSRAFFELAHRTMGYPSVASVLVVGDSRVSDVTGPMDYGFDACWYNPSGQVATDAYVPIFEARSLGEVHTWLTT